MWYGVSSRWLGGRNGRLCGNSFPYQTFSHRAISRDPILTKYPGYLSSEVDLDRCIGSALCSLVGFQFLDNRVLGIGWYGSRHFPK